MGDIPLMTNNGTFVVNGTERVIVSQMHRSPGVFFDHDKGKTHSSGKLLFAARIIPYRGSWLDIEFDAKDIVHARIDRRRKIPVTSLLYALGMDGEEILNTFYKKVIYKRQKEGWRVPFDANRFRGYKAINDLVDADTGKVVLEAGKKLTVRSARQLAEKGLKALRMTDLELVGHYIAEDLVNPKTGEIYAEAGEEITEKTLKALIEHGYKELPLLDIDHVNVGAYIRNTLTVDKNMTREDALFDIYRVMRPGEPPTRRHRAGDVPVAVLRFRALRPLGGRPREDEHAARPRRARHHARAAQGRHPRGDHDAGRPARRQGRDRRHRPPRQPPGALGRRADGEPVPHRPPAHGARDQGAHVVGRYRHRHAAGPDQRQAGGGGGARVLRLLAALAVHGPDQPAVRDHAQAAALGAGPGRSHARACRLRGARRAPDALRPHLPDRDAGRSEHRPDQFARDLCAGEQVRLRRDAVPQGQGRPRHRRGAVSLGDGGGPLHGRAGQRPDRRARPLHRRADRVPSCRRRAAAGAGQGRLHGRVAEAARFGGGGAHPVPGERRRQPRADGLEHAAPGGAAGSRRGAVRRHRHGRRGRPRFRRRDRGPPHRRDRSGGRHPYRRARDRRDRSDQAGRRHLPADEVPALEPEHLHQPASAGEGRRSRQEGRHHRRRSVDRSRRARARPQRAGRVHAVERLQLRRLRSCSPSGS